MMDMATHGPWCNARGYETRCPLCGEPVFYWYCDCGCKVFFEKGVPIKGADEKWPKHFDHCPGVGREARQFLNAPYLVASGVIEDVFVEQIENLEEIASPRSIKALFQGRLDAEIIVVLINTYDGQQFYLWCSPLTEAYGLTERDLRGCRVEFRAHAKMLPSGVCVFAGKITKFLDDFESLPTWRWS
jgi:hypothetical protein